MTSEQRLKALASTARRLGLTVWQWAPGPVGVHAPNSLHYQHFRDGVGKAFDVYGSRTRMLLFRLWIRRHHPYLTEGIWNAGRASLSIKNGKRVPASYWGGVTWAEHTNHMHLGIL